MKIHVEGLSKRFGDRQVLRRLDVTVESGQIVALLGESGSGKSVFLQHCIGLMTPDEGRIWLGESEITALSEKELLLLRRHVGYLFQDGALFDFMTVFDNVAFPLREHTRWKRTEIREKVVSLLNLVGLKDAAEKYPSELSGGMRKRAALARSIVLDSRVLFCDEPTSGLDPLRSEEIMGLIQDVARRNQCTVLITSHDMRNALKTADRILMLHEGRFVADGPPQTIEKTDNDFIQAFLRASR